MNIGIIGAGAIGRKHAAAAGQSGANVRWVVDVDLAQAQELAKEHGAEAADSADALWADRATSAVIVAVPNKWHADVAIAALDAGKDVLLEKPMACTVAECQAINQAALANGRVLQVGFVHRFTAVGRLAKSLADEGRCGRIYHARAQLSLRRGVPGLGKWFTTKEISGGGALIDVGVHLIDLALHVMDYPQLSDVCGQTYATFGCRMKEYDYDSMWSGPPDYEGVFNVEDAAHALVRFRNGSTLQLDVAWAGNFPQPSTPVSSMVFLGDRGGMSFELFGDHVNLAAEQEGKIVDQRIDAAEPDFYQDQLRVFLDGVTTRSNSGATGVQGEIVQSIVEQIYQGAMIPA
ncbi:MAG: Gfo/Idh/MocA family oxidoreductase [Planctomycetales bacterium]|nr:Gfo/Idh/MocA family oxidoreductase [Planctomycetales bacterium]